MLEAIADVETRWTHFAQHAGAPCPNDNHFWGGTAVARYPWMTCDGGYGVMQLTGPPPPSRIQIWNWQANVGGGLNTLADAHTRAANFFDDHPYAGEITDEMWRREMYGWYNGGGYYDWKEIPPQSGTYDIVPQSIQCDCDGSERKGRLINSQGELGDVCRTRGRCYADYIFNHNAEDW